MPKRTDIQKILVIGAGPIMIGQGCEFDYSGTQACNALRELGYTIVLVNSNAATIMNNREIADRTYIEPLTLEFLEKIIELQKPDALLPTVGGQTALNLAIELEAAGILAKFNVEMIGADSDVIKRAEDRGMFNDILNEIGLRAPKNIIANDARDAQKYLDTMGLPLIIRPSFTLGGSGGGIAYNSQEFKAMLEIALDASITRKVQIDESLIGWKEYELEVMRDAIGNFIVVCAIENIDPMGTHTGDSITVAPTFTLTDKEFQSLRDAAKKIINAVGMTSGGANVQFAVNPINGDQVVIEMNPRVSRSSALASKATGYPIAKISAMLAVGMTLDEIENDCTVGIPASFEPALDYVVVKMPRFNFEKFPDSDNELYTTMQSVGESMAIGASFAESLQKALQALEIGKDGVYFEENLEAGRKDSLIDEVSRSTPDRLLICADLLRLGISVEELYRLTSIDPWFLHQINIKIVQMEETIRQQGIALAADLFEYKNAGFSDRRIGTLVGTTAHEVYMRRRELGVRPNYRKVDSCAAEFDTRTNYLYSTYSSAPGSIVGRGQDDRFYGNDSPEILKGGAAARETKSDINDNNKYGGSYDFEVKGSNDINSLNTGANQKRKVIIIGSGCNRIGQGIEFDYSCVHASWAVREMGFESIMINCNPETVSTDYKTSDKLYFEPLDIEHVLEVIDHENETGEIFGVIVQFGGQTALSVTKGLVKYGIKILGTDPRQLDIAEDRDHFRTLLLGLNMTQPPSTTVSSADELMEIAFQIESLSFEFSYPILVRPSNVLGGRAMSVIYDKDQLLSYIAVHPLIFKTGPLLVDSFLEGAIELDVDVLSDGEDVVVAGIMEHIEEAGVHSGDSICATPPPNLDQNMIQQIEEIATKLARALEVKGLLNIQLAIKDTRVFVIEANPRASRTVPFLSKAIGVALPQIATKIMCGQKIRDLRIDSLKTKCWAVKMPVFPFLKFRDADFVLGPEMRSTGEVMGIGSCFEEAFLKAFVAVHKSMPISGKVLISVKHADKNDCLIEVAQLLEKMNFEVLATRGTSDFLTQHGIKVAKISKLRAVRPNVLDLILDKKICLYLNTSDNSKAMKDGMKIRRAAMLHSIPCITTMNQARVLVQAIKYNLENVVKITMLQDL